jgi:hypothetical protein
MDWAGNILNKRRMLMKLFDLAGDIALEMGVTKEFVISALIEAGYNKATEAGGIL